MPYDTFEFGHALYSEDCFRSKSPFSFDGFRVKPMAHPQNSNEGLTTTPPNASQRNAALRRIYSRIAQIYASIQAHIPLKGEFQDQL
ncbi:MAG: hypothetical protein Hens3KO_06040 [Henriciella sp.]